MGACSRDLELTWGHRTKGRLRRSCRRAHIGISLRPPLSPHDSLPLGLRHRPALIFLPPPRRFLPPPPPFRPTCCCTAPCPPSPSPARSASSRARCPRSSPASSSRHTPCTPSRSPTYRGAPRCSARSSSASASWRSRPRVAARWGRGVARSAAPRVACWWPPRWRAPYWPCSPRRVVWGGGHFYVATFVGGDI